MKKEKQKNKVKNKNSNFGIMKVVTILIIILIQLNLIKAQQIKVDSIDIYFESIFGQKLTSIGGCDNYIINCSKNYCNIMTDRFSKLIYFKYENELKYLYKHKIKVNSIITEESYNNGSPESIFISEITKDLNMFKNYLENEITELTPFMNDINWSKNALVIRRNKINTNSEKINESHIDYNNIEIDSIYIEKKCKIVKKNREKLNSKFDRSKLYQVLINMDNSNGKIIWLDYKNKWYELQ